MSIPDKPQTTPSAGARCQQCGQAFDPAANHDQACVYHPGQLKGDLATFNAYYHLPWNAEKARAIINEHIDDDGPWWYWTCCEQSGQTAPGCVRSAHREAAAT